ncbi:MAG: efflux RND transporter permease subunit [Proteobacteria bacterium]|nr:efflux RND transporter permease subunit [Pseudomonadota bacterium]
MIVSDTAVTKSTTVMVLALIIIVFGVYCYNVLPRESDPDITIPNVFVTTDYRGVSPTDMETAVTIEIEKKLKGLDGVKKIQSVSSEGLSSINIEFVTGTNIDQALQDVKDKVDEAKKELPTDLENDPSVFEVNFSELPIVVFSMSGTCGLAVLKKIADDLKDDIEAIPGVLEVVVTGGLEREIRVEVSPDKLAYYNMSIPTFQKILYSENQNTSGGAIRMGDGRFQLQVPGEFRTPSEIYGLVMGTHNGQPIYLKDLAKVVDGFKEETSRSRLDGRSAVNIAVKKRSGENIIAISDRIDALLAARKPAWPSGTEIVKVMDKAKDIRNMVVDLENNILSGLVLVVVVLFFALGFRNAVLVSLATIKYSGSIGDIVRINNKRVVTVKAHVEETKIPGPVARAQAEKLLEKFSLPPGYTVTFTGVSYDFRHLTISWVSESSQWWRSMAVVVIFGLMLATFLTLIVVPTLYFVVDSLAERRRQAAQWLHRIYWKPYPWLAGGNLHDGASK